MIMADDDPKVPKVKDLLSGGASLADVVDAATRAELERWFGLPSFAQLADRPVAEEDPEMVQARERRETATNNVDPKLVEWLSKRADFEPWKARIQPTIHVDPKIARIDLDRVEAMHKAIAEPRQLELPPDLEDDLRECAPQALLRDLHREETDFEKTFEMVDAAAEQRFDIVAEVKAAMAMSLKLGTLDQSPYQQARLVMADLVAARRAPWADIPSTLPNRRVRD